MRPLVGSESHRIDISTEEGMLRHSWMIGAALLVLVSPVRAEDFRFKEKKFGPAELRYFGNVPVLFVEGTPEEIGKQTAELAGDAAPGLTAYFKNLLRANQLDKALPALKFTSNNLLRRFPAAYRKELETMLSSFGSYRDLIVIGNTLWDIGKLEGCSTYVIEPERSKSGGPLFGRNFDFPALGTLQQFTMVIVCKPKGKHAFASVNFPGLVGVHSGMNDQGLAIAVLDIPETADGSPRINLAAVPMILSFRRILEECSTVEEAEAILRATPRTTLLSLSVCDRTHAALFELTPKNVHRREPEDHVLISTNHFRTEGLATKTVCWRYALMEASKAAPKIGLDDVKQMMDHVNQGELTIQTMVFEPQAMRMHVGVGTPPVSSRPLQLLDLTELFGSRGGDKDAAEGSSHP
jgi:isopenicillin-N N-acyltransferase-like protein